MNWPLFYPCLGALLTSFVLSLGIREMAHRLGALDRPAEHKQHREPIPTMGGLAVFISFAVGLYLRGWPSAALLTVLIASSLIVVVGVMDDAKGVNAVIKLGVLAAATLILYQGGISLHLGRGDLIDCFITFLWVGFISSAFNGIDNSDGSAAGVASICALFTFAIAWASWQRDLAIVAALLVCSCLGFLVFNFPRPRATLFLGDTGSFFLGFALATMMLLGQWGATGMASACVALVLIGFPILDFMFILVVRGLQGRYRTPADPITMCARDHIYHRLVAFGLQPRAAVLSIYALSALYGSAATAMVNLTTDKLWLAFVVVLVLATTQGVMLARVRLPEEVYSHISARSDAPRARRGESAER